MAVKVVCVSGRAVGAARLRIICDLAFERETPEWVEKLARARGSSPWEPPDVVPLRVRKRRARREERLMAVLGAVMIIGLALLGQCTPSSLLLSSG